MKPDFNFPGCYLLYWGLLDNVIKRLISELASKNQVISFILFLLVSASLALVVFDSVFDYFMSRLGGLYLPQYTNKGEFGPTDAHVHPNPITGLENNQFTSLICFRSVKSVLFLYLQSNFLMELSHHICLLFTI
jgi:hypothetical protein